MKTIANPSKAHAQFTRNSATGSSMVNANTVQAGLQQQFILQDVVIRDFTRRVIGLDMFSTVFRNVPLDGLDVVDVHYYDLDQPRRRLTPAATTTSSPTRLRSASEPVGWGPTKDGALGVGHARLVQALSFTSQEIARQPYLKIAQRAALKAEKLAFDIFQDVLSASKWPTSTPARRR